MTLKTIPPGKWPPLVYEDLKDTLTTVLLWAQIIGKIRLVKTPWINHSWHVTLYVSARGLTTGSIPFEAGSFQIDFDFVDHKLLLIASNGSHDEFGFYMLSVADFYRVLFDKLAGMGIEAEIYAKPNELPDAIPFAKDTIHKTYDPAQMNKYWQALVNIDSVFTRFRAEFIGKCSPVHLFWGGFDLAVSRFSGREAPLYQGKIPNMSLKVMQEAYSHEVSSAGFWGGNEQFPHPVFYSYCYPTPGDYGKQPVEPAEAFYHTELGEFLLPYEQVQASGHPEITLLKFLRSTYKAAAETANWDPKLVCDLTGFEK
jgi:hypothetical protein